MTSRLGTSATACTLEGKGTAVLHGDVVQVVKVPAWLLRPVPLGYRRPMGYSQLNEGQATRMLLNRSTGRGDGMLHTVLITQELPATQNQLANAKNHYLKLSS